MLRTSRTTLIHYVVLTWQSDGGAVTRALHSLGFRRPYTLKTMMSTKENGGKHPGLWANLLRPENELFEVQQTKITTRDVSTKNKKKKLQEQQDGGGDVAAAEGEAAAAAATDSSSSSNSLSDRATTIQSRLENYNKMALKLGVQSSRKLTIDDLADYDLVAGLPVSAIPPQKLLEIFPKYTKFILVEEVDKRGWAARHIEDGVIPLLTALRATIGTGTASASPTAKCWRDAFRHFAWPGSASTVMETLPEEEDALKIRSGFANSPLSAAAAALQGATKDDGRNVVTQVADLKAVEWRRNTAEAALADFEREVKATIPEERLFVFREDGVDGWPELCFMTNKLDKLETLAGKKEFPKKSESFGSEMLLGVKHRVSKAAVFIKLFNGAAVLVIFSLLYFLNQKATVFVQRVYAEASTAVGTTTPKAAVEETKKKEE